MTYCRVARLCKVCGFEWSTKVSNALHLGSGCGRCAKRAASNALRLASIDEALPGFVYRFDSVCGKYSKVGFTQDLKKRKTKISWATPFAVSDAISILFQGSALEAFSLEQQLISRSESAGFSGFSGATEWLLSEDLDKKLLDR